MNPVQDGLLLAHNVDSLDQFPGQFQSPAMSGYVHDLACRGEDGWELRMISIGDELVRKCVMFVIMRTWAERNRKNVPGVHLVS